MNELLQATDLCLFRDGKAIIDRLDVTLTAGEMVALIGPNGAGKRQQPVGDGYLLQLQHRYLASATLMLSITIGSSGVMSGAKRWITLPSRPIRNFSKFHRMSPCSFGARPLLSMRS